MSRRVLAQHGGHQEDSPPAALALVAAPAVMVRVMIGEVGIVRAARGLADRLRGAGQGVLERPRDGRAGALVRGVDEQCLGQGEVVERIDLLAVVKRMQAIFRGRGDVGRPTVDVRLERRFSEGLEQLGRGVDARPAVGVCVAAGRRGRQGSVAIRAVGRRPSRGWASRYSQARRAAARSLAA